MDQHTAHADAAQQEHVLGKREIGILVDRGAAELHDDGLAGPLTNVRQRFDENAGDFGWKQNELHDVLLFSLM